MPDLSSALGSNPYAAAAQGVIGLGQTIGGYIQQHRATKQYNKMIDNYQPNQSIMDYYGKALNRYNQNPYDSAMYRLHSQNAGRGLTTGLNALQDRRSALAGVSSLVRGYDDSMLKAAAQAEGQQAQALGQLGQATGMKAAEDKYKFEAKANLLAAKAAGGSQIMNSGIQNLYGGLGNISDFYMAKNMYGGGSTPFNPQTPKRP